MKFIALLGALALAALSACSPSQTAAVSSAEAKAALVKKGALFCAKASGIDGEIVVMLANASGVPVTVTNQASAAVATGCAMIDAIPVSPPANPASVPIVASNTTLPPA